MSQPGGSPKSGSGETAQYDNPIVKALGGIGGIGNPVGANPINYAEQFPGNPSGYNSPVPQWNLLGPQQPISNTTPIELTGTQPQSGQVPVEETSTTNPASSYTGMLGFENSPFGLIGGPSGLQSDASASPGGGIGVPISNTPVSNTAGVGTYGNFYGAPGQPGAEQMLAALNKGATPATGGAGTINNQGYGPGA